MLRPPTDLRCEFLTNPLGVHADPPRLSWRMDDGRAGARQTAYQVIAGPSPDNLTAWDSGRRSSDQSLHVPYGGGTLASRQRVYWAVRVWDQDGQPTPYSRPAFFEAGLLNRSDWEGQWVGSPVTGGPRTTAPCPYLRKAFTAGEIVKARLYVTALGLYEIHFNGRRVSNDVFTPGRTEYARRVPYQVYDVAEFLKTGENAIGAILGDGWFCGHVHSDPRQRDGDRPWLLAQLEITHADGSKQVVVTDSSWTTTTGPLRASDLLMGEDYDARLDLGDWSSPDYHPGRREVPGSGSSAVHRGPGTRWVPATDTEWSPVVTLADPGIAIVPSTMPPVRPIEEIRPVAPPRKLTRRRWIFDLGQNMVGRCRVKLTGPRGTTVSIRHSEMLDKDGMLYTAALRSARATDYYTKATDGEETYEPRFTFHGFRYVEIRGIDGDATEDTVTGVVLHTDLPETGSFECSDPLINKLQSNIRWSQKGNFLEIPTDCPQRDERLGWTGDAQVFARTAAFNMDVAAFFAKWLQDVQDAQFPPEHKSAGGIPSTVPFCPSIPNEGGPAWSDAAVIIPWTMYLCFGDIRILADRYAMMGRFIDYLMRTSPGYLRAGSQDKWRGYGDWLSHDAHTPNDLIGTAFFAHDAQLMAQIAKVLGKDNDAAGYLRLFEDVRAAWQEQYLAGDDLAAKTQTAYLLALQFDLTPEALRPRLVEKLAADIESRGMHLSTGFVGTPYLCDVLTRFGRTDVAFSLLTQKTFPSWLFPVTHGATTMWERWDGWTPEKGFASDGMNSYNHYAYGAVGAWIYRTIAGIDLDPQRPAYKHILLRPTVGGGLTHAKATLKSPYGLVESAWRIEGDVMHYTCLVPPNTTATLALGGRERELGPGRHDVVSPSGTGYQPVSAE